VPIYIHLAVEARQLLMEVFVTLKVVKVRTGSGSASQGTAT